MAEGFANYYAKGILKAHSAGSRPAGFIMPATIEVMQEKGIDISHQISKGLTAVPLERIAWIINLEVSLEKFFKTASRRTELLHWFVPDPVGQSLDTYRAVRDEIELRVVDFIDRIQKETWSPQAE
jgi:arsenate reductase